MQRCRTLLRRFVARTTVDGGGSVLIENSCCADCLMPGPVSHLRVVFLATFLVSSEASNLGKGFSELRVHSPLAPPPLPSMKPELLRREQVVVCRCKSNFFSLSQLVLRSTSSTVFPIKRDLEVKQKPRRFFPYPNRATENAC
jgi:hypothetical protein